MQIERGRIVRSAAGRDNGYYLAVVEVADSTIRLCDGKERPLTRPKSKNIKHILVTGGMLTDAQLATDRAIRRGLREYASTQNQTVKSKA